MRSIDTSGAAVADLRTGPRPRFALFGGPPDTGNLGVSALGLSSIAGVREATAHTASITVFDHGPGSREASFQTPEGTYPFTRRGAWWSRRIYRPDSLVTMDAISRVTHRANANLRDLARSTAVLDLSGGDSFCDLYGRKRFAGVTIPKRLALRLGRPLVLLPQTYGPFMERRSARMAGEILRGCHQAWARDPESFERLVELLGSGFDPARHLQGVDVAFALPAIEPSGPLAGFRSWTDEQAPVVGVNVSGLLFNDPASAVQRFGLRADYPAATRALVTALLAEGCRVVLVPHVLGTSDESDVVACERLMAEFSGRGTLMSLPEGLGAAETKWAISRLDWFTGARMHATIAALSSEVPAAATAYSLKTRGVFTTCGVGDHVVDARTLSTSDLVDALLASFHARREVADRLRRRMPSVRARAREQFSEVVCELQGQETEREDPNGNRAAPVEHRRSRRGPE